MARRLLHFFALATTCSAVLLPIVSTPVAAAPTEDVDFRRITFPVEGATHYSDDWGAPREGGRKHQGNDVMGSKLQHEVAVRDGTITMARVDTGTGLSGNMLTLTDKDGWFYYYIHINNDTPGTDDGANPAEFRFAPGIDAGSKVKAGQFIAFMGDSGDAETTAPHLHFEVHRPDGTAIDPWPSLRLAQGLAANGRCRYDDNPRGIPSANSGAGYYTLGSDGGVFTFGNVPFLGSTGGMKLNQPVVGMATRPKKDGYWLVARDGGIFSFGDAPFLGSAGGMKLNAPVLTLVSTPTGNGYWLLASDGGVFTFGDAKFFGSTGSQHLNAPVVGMAATPTGNGYWLLARDGGVFSFGDALFYGSTGAQRLNSAVVGMAATPHGDGYWLLAGDGGIFTFGGAGWYGALPGTGLCSWPNAATMAVTATGKGYWVEGVDGSTWAFGDARWLGAVNALGRPANAPTIGFALVG